MNPKTTEQIYFLKLIRSVICESTPDLPPKSLDWQKLWEIAKKHHLANLISYAIDRLVQTERPGDEVLKKFQNNRTLFIVKEAAQQISMEKLLPQFEKCHIDHMPLKGYYLKNLYPKPDMRSMSDIDILFQETQMHQVKEAMLASDFDFEQEGPEHDIYTKLPFIHIEAHRRLSAEKSPYYFYFKDIWQKSHLAPSTQHLYLLSIEDQYHYLVMHLAKHLLNGGAGVRSVLDLYLYEKNILLKWTGNTFKTK